MKKLFRLFTACLALFSFILISCSNSAAGGDSNNGGGTPSAPEIGGVSAGAQLEKGVAISVDIPENISIVELRRQNKGEDFSQVLYTKTNCTKGSFTITDYFVEEGKNYTYWSVYRTSDWAVKGNSSKITITAEHSGYKAPSLTNTPSITYNRNAKNFSFSPIPTYENNTSPLTDFPKVSYELLYKCDDEDAYETVCTFEPDKNQTKEIYNWIYEKHTGHTFKFSSIYIKFSSNQSIDSYTPTEYYSFPLYINKSIPDFKLESPEDIQERAVYTCAFADFESNSTAIKSTNFIEFTFNTDGTFSTKENGENSYSGTYTGNAAKDGEIELTATDANSNELKFKLNISDGKFVFINDSPGVFSTIATKAAYVMRTIANDDTENTKTTTTETITFYEDNSFIVYFDQSRKSGVDADGFSCFAAMGTYTGNPATDGSITCTLIKETNNEGVLVDSTSTASFQITITNGLIIYNSKSYTRFYPAIATGNTTIQDDVVYTCVSPDYGNNGNAVPQPSVLTFRFNKDNTFSSVMDGVETNTGTYTGNPIQDGELTVTMENSEIGEEYNGSVMQLTVFHDYLTVNDFGPGVFSRKKIAAAYSLRKQENDVRVTETLTFFTDGTVVIYEIQETDSNSEHTVPFTGVVVIGNYTGNPADNGTITCIPDYMIDQQGKLKKVTESDEGTITVTVNNEVLSMPTESNATDDYNRFYTASTN